MNNYNNLLHPFATTSQLSDVHNQLTKQINELKQLTINSLTTPLYGDLKAVTKLFRLQVITSNEVIYRCCIG